MLNFRFGFLRHKYDTSYWATMSEILLKDMESISMEPVSVEERPDGGRSFLLVDEQENLQVKFAYVIGANSC